jgi:hypothetical protein
MQANMQRQRETWRHELSGLRIQRLELEQRDASHPALQAVEAAIRAREQQLERAAAGVAYPRGTGGCWQVRVVAKPCERMVDWRKMKVSLPFGEGWLAWRKLFEDVRYIAWPEDDEWAWSIARSEPRTLASWKELFARVNLDVEEMDQDDNVVQDAGDMIEVGDRVIEVGALGKDMQRDQRKRARCMLAEQRRVLGPTRPCGCSDHY